MVWLMYEGNVEGDDFIMFGWCRIQDEDLGYTSLNELMEIGVVVLDERTPLGTLDEMMKKEKENW